MQGITIQAFPLQEPQPEGKPGKLLPFVKANQPQSHKSIGQDRSVSHTEMHFGIGSGHRPSQSTNEPQARSHELTELPALLDEAPHGEAEEQIGNEGSPRESCDSQDVAVEQSTVAEAYRSTSTVPEASLVQEADTEEAARLGQPFPMDDIQRLASEASVAEGKRQNKELFVSAYQGPFQSQEWQPHNTDKGSPSKSELYGSLEDGSPDIRSEAALEYDEVIADVLEGHASMRANAEEADFRSVEGDPSTSAMEPTSFRKSLPEQQDRSSLEVTILHEAKPDYGNAATAEADTQDGGKVEDQEACFTSHIDKDLLEDPDLKEEMSPTDFKSIADSSLGSQDLNKSQQFGTLNGSESLARDTAKLSGTARKRGRARQPRFAFPKQTESTLGKTTSQLEEAEHPRNMQASSQVGSLSRP